MMVNLLKTSKRRALHLGLLLAVLSPVLALFASSGSAGASARHTAEAAQYCSSIPFEQGVPPWAFSSGKAITGATGSYARGHGNINLSKNTVSGILCQVNRVRHHPDRLIIMTAEHHLVYHTHYAHKWGYPGNLIKVHVRVKSSTDSRCKVGTVGLLTVFGSYNGVRSDSVQYKFPAACSDHDHTYHGPQVNVQVPPR